MPTEPNNIRALLRITMPAMPSATVRAHRDWPNLAGPRLPRSRRSTPGLALRFTTSPRLPDPSVPWLARHSPAPPYLPRLAHHAYDRLAIPPRRFLDRSASSFTRSGSTTMRTHAYQPNSQHAPASTNPPNSKPTRLHTAERIARRSDRSASSAHSRRSSGSSALACRSQNQSHAMRSTPCRPHRNPLRCS